jgi:exosortase/archaeosortase family protein
MKIERGFGILFRYIILFILMFSLGLIYWIFTPLTIYSVGGLLKLIFENVLIQGNIIVIEFENYIEIIPACIAGSAYLLLLILNLSVPMKFKKRIYSILFSFGLLFVLNVLRIFILSIMYANGNEFFDITHKVFWYGLSTVFVVGIWFLMVYIFKIKEIPVYSDVKYFLKSIRSGNGGKGKEVKKKKDNKKVRGKKEAGEKKEKNKKTKKKK